MTRLSDEELARLRAFAIDEMRAINPSPMYERGRTLLALLDEITRLRAERDEAYLRGREEMKARCVQEAAEWAEVFAAHDQKKSAVYGAATVREEIRALPISDPSKGGE